MDFHVQSAAAPGADATPALSPLRRPMVQLGLLVLACTIAAFARIALGPVQETMRLSLGWSDNQFALLQGAASALPLGIAVIPLGLFIDRHSRVRFIIVCAIINLLATLGSATTNFWLLLCLRALLGVTAPAIVIATILLIADYFPAERRGRANMVMSVSYLAGFSAVYAMGGWLVVQIGGPESWRWTLVWLGVAMAVPTLALALLREPARSGTHPRHGGNVGDGRRILSDLRDLWRHRMVMGPLLGGAAIVGIADGGWVLSTSVLRRDFGVTPDAAGATIATVTLVSGIAGPVVGGVLADWCVSRGGPRRTLLALGLLIVLSVPAGLFALAPDALSASRMLTLFLVAGSAANLAVVSLVTVVIPKHLHGLAISTLIATMLLAGASIAPLLVSGLSDAMGGPVMLGRAMAIVCVAGSLLAACVFLVGRKSFPSTA